MSLIDVFYSIISNNLHFTHNPDIMVINKKMGAMKKDRYEKKICSM